MARQQAKVRPVAANKIPEKKTAQNGKGIVPYHGRGELHPERGRGRPPGSPNKITARLKHALFLAAECKGNLTPKRDDKGNLIFKGGKLVLLNDDGTGDRLVDYLCYLAQEHPVTFAQGLFRCLPQELRVEEKTAPPTQTALNDEEEIVRYLRREGAAEGVARLAAAKMLEGKRILEGGGK